MLHLVKIGARDSVTAAVLVLPYDVRQKSRFRAVLEDGREVAVLLPRSGILRDGDVLEDEHGFRVRVRSAPESVSIASTEDPLLLTRAAYHMGNRHVPLQIDDDCLVYQHDHVLDEMLRELGMKVVSTVAPFEPESGAYANHSHGNGHGRRHDHGVQ